MISFSGPGYKNQYNGRMHHFKRPSDVKAKVENKPTIYEIAQEKDVMKRLNGWKVHHLTAQMEDLASTEKSVCIHFLIPYLQRVFIER